MTEDALKVAESYRKSIDFLFGRLNFERNPDAAQSLVDFKLVRMEELLARLGNPQQKLATVHVAGSKGKGSTATMIARIAQAAGYKVGLFTSPHVDQFEERFTINGKSAGPEEIIALVETIKPVVEQMDETYTGQGVTFFEIATAMGWLHFARNQVDLAIMEVGLGGRLDSTNVCNPTVTAITSISRDHTRLLGDTLAEIAREKAGIIKPGIPVVSGVIDSEPAHSIEEIARDQSAPLYRLGKEIRYESHGPAALTTLPSCYQLDVKTVFGELNALELAMPGEHQTRNAALAVQVVQLLSKKGFDFQEADIRNGLKAAHCPLRIEVMKTSPLTIIDAAHNAASITALCETLKTVSAVCRHVIFATSRDKELDSLLTILNDHFDQIWLTRYSNNPRAVPLNDMELAAKARLSTPWKILPDLPTAINHVRNVATADDLICLTGSFFLAAEAKQILSQM